MEKFSTFTSTINPRILKNSKYVFNQNSAQKKLVMDSGYGYSSGCDNVCSKMEDQISGKSICLSPRKYNNSEMKQKKGNSFDWAPINYDIEGFSNSSILDNTVDGHEACNRPQFIEGKLNDQILTRTWSFCGDSCKALNVNKNNWDYADEKFSGNRKSVDSKILPFRSLPEYKKMSEPFLVNNVVENQNLLTYYAEQSSPIKKAFGFDQNTKCCHNDNEKASVFQNLDETKLSNTMRLLDYASGDIKYSDIDSSSYDDIRELPTLDNQL